MSEREDDPVDAAYVQAEALLDDDAARAARRARVLGAVAAERPTNSAPQRRRSWQAGRWLAAASVAGLAAFVALRTDMLSEAPPQRVQPQQSAEAEPPVANAATPAVTAPESPPAPKAPSASVTAEAEANSPREARSFETPPAPPPSLAAAEVAQAPAPPPPAPAPPPPPPPPPPRSEDASEMMVRGSRAAAPPAAARARAAPSAAMDSGAPPFAERAADSLHAAAAVGRVEELRSLLAQGVAVDEPDAAGETALMKAIRANQPAAVALLRRRGADLDRQNDAGQSARDLATAIDDPRLYQALGLTP